MVKSLIPAGAAVRDNKTGLLGKVFRNPHGNARGHITVQWDGDRDRKTVRLMEVSYVARDYDAVLDSEARRILAMSDEQVIAEAEAQGINTKVEATRLRAILEAVLAKARKQN